MTKAQKPPFIYPTHPEQVILPDEFEIVHRVSRETRKRMRARGDFPPTVQLSEHRWGIVWGRYLKWRDERLVS